MKRTRILILSALVIAALFAAVLPALANGVLNQSFEGDKNGDNIPDKWNTKGDVVRLCDHAYAAYTLDNCMMVFTPSSKGAALWQRIYRDPADGWTVFSEEGHSAILGEIYYGRKQLDWGRAYFGVKFFADDGTQYLLYDEIPGGTENFDWDFFDTWCGETWCADLHNGIVYNTINEIAYGILMLPGDGYLAVDMMYYGT